MSKNTARIVVLVASELRIGIRSSVTQPTGPPVIRNERRRDRPGQLYTNGTSRVHDAVKNRAGSYPSRIIPNFRDASRL